jgi:glucan phosphorylase
VRAVLGGDGDELVPLDVIRMLGGADRLDMTVLGLNASSYVNGVAKRHGEASRAMFAGYAIDAVTNGVHSRTWTCDSFRRLFDAHIPGWSNDPFALRNAVKLSRADVWQAHAGAKWRLVEELGRRGVPLSTESFTLGFARRATPYKRADLLLSDPRQLVETAPEVGPIQILYAGKAHPRDQAGKDLIRRIVSTAAAVGPLVRVAYLENYDLDLARLLTAGADLWVNTPLRPLEASGTSRMKAAHNGVPSFSVLDGWWIEGHIEGVTGWSIGPATPADRPDDDGRGDADDLYRKLRAVVAPLFYGDRPVGGRDAPGRRVQRLVLQHPPHGSAVCRQRLRLSGRTRAAHRGSRGAKDRTADVRFRGPSELRNPGPAVPCSVRPELPPREVGRGAWIINRCYRSPQNSGGHFCRLGATLKIKSGSAVNPPAGIVRSGGERTYTSSIWRTSCFRRTCLSP